MAQRLDGAFLADGSRQEDEGGVRRLGCRDLERGEPLEARQGKVAQDDVRLEARKRRAKARFRVHSRVNAPDTTPSELLDGEIGVDADVLDDQRAQAVRLQVARHSCATPDEATGKPEYRRAASIACRRDFGQYSADYCAGQAKYLRRWAFSALQSSLMFLKSTPSERSLRYRWVRSMPTRLASWPTLPLH